MEIPFKNGDFIGLWSSLIFLLFFFFPLLFPILEGEQTEARITTAVLFLDGTSLMLYKIQQKWVAEY